MSEQIGKSRWLIVADDLTGALDSSAPFALAGRRVCVASRPDALLGALGSGADVVAVSTRSREIPADQARSVMAQVVAQRPADMRLFKKVDSRLKGHIAAELSVLPNVPFLVAPAIPQFGRVVRDGCVDGFGVSPPIPIAPVIGRQAIIPETLCDADIAKAVDAAPSDTIFVGAMGLAQALAGPATTKPQVLAGRIGMAIGSTDPITLAQLDILRGAGVPVISAPGGVWAGDVPDQRASVLHASDDGVAHDRAEVAARFAASASAFLEGHDSLVLSGGATAEAVLDALGMELLEMVGEALPGLPVSRANGRLIVTKSGGFGAPDSLHRLIQEAKIAE